MNERQEAELERSRKRKATTQPNGQPIKKRKPGKNRDLTAMTEKDQIWRMVFNLDAIDNREKRPEIWTSH